MNINVEIACDNKKWDKHQEINAEKVQDVLIEILNRYKNLSKIQEIELSILLTDNKAMSSLNKEFRNNDKATNVLSFADTEIDWRKILEFKPNTDYMYLGDIAFGYDITLKEAQDKDWKFIDYFTHLLIHAILHLLGYDHEEEVAAEAMEQLEINVLKKFNIPSPY
jgi:probable rRNA maturation factor